MKDHSNAPLIPRLDSARRAITHQTTVGMLQFLVDADIQIYGKASPGTLDAIHAQGCTLRGHRVCRKAQHIF